jgi:hypothetical protein
VPLFDNLQRVTLVLLRSGRAQHSAQSAGDTTRSTNHLAEISLGHLEFDNGLVAVFVLVNKNLCRSIDQRLGNVLDQRSRIGRLLGH